MRGRDGPGEAPSCNLVNQTMPFTNVAACARKGRVPCDGAKKMHTKAQRITYLNEREEITRETFTLHAVNGNARGTIFLLLILLP